VTSNKNEVTETFEQLDIAAVREGSGSFCVLGAKLMFDVMKLQGVLIAACS
jgi:hypothetical protein